jgi:hypothetical protein
MEPRRRRHAAVVCLKFGNGRFGWCWTRALAIGVKNASGRARWTKLREWLAAT